MTMKIKTMIVVNKKLKNKCKISNLSIDYKLTYKQQIAT